MARLERETLRGSSGSFMCHVEDSNNIYVHMRMNEHVPAVLQLCFWGWRGRSHARDGQRQQTANQGLGRMACLRPLGLG